ncbi:MAG TPA: hypothetical protein VGE95_08930 [Arthrobacter sp.]
MRITRDAHSQHRRHQFVGLGLKCGAVRFGLLTCLGTAGPPVALPPSEEQKSDRTASTERRVEKSAVHAPRDI